MSLSDVIENYQASFVPPLSDPVGTDGSEGHFAKRVFPADPKERRMFLKYNFIKQAADQIGARLEINYTPSEQELGVAKHLQAQLTQAAFDQWVWSMHDPPRDPGIGWVFANNFPEQRQRMIDLLNLKHDILEQLMILKTKSFPDEQDALLLYVINTMAPTERQRFLTWLVGNDRSDTVLKAIVGPDPVLGSGLRDHNTFAKAIIKNAAGRSRGNELQDLQGYNYTDRIIPNGLWKKMTAPEFVDAIELVNGHIYGAANNRQDMSKLFAQFQLRGRNDYTLPTPYTANAYAEQERGRGTLTIAQSEPRGNVTRRWYQSQAGFNEQIKHILSGLKSNQQ